MNHQLTLIVVVITLISLSACSHSKESEPSNPPEQAAPPAQPAAKVLGLEPGWELAPAATYTAVHKGNEVTITARGESPTAGYEVKLVMSPLRIWPPQWMLAHKKPDGPAAHVITPFEVKASFKSDEPIQSVKVTDAAGGHAVPVKRAGN